MKENKEICANVSGIMDDAEMKNIAGGYGIYHQWAEAHAAEELLMPAEREINPCDLLSNVVIKENESFDLLSNVIIKENESFDSLAGIIVKANEKLRML